jgi:hypothetical protein
LTIRGPFDAAITRIAAALERERCDVFGIDMNGVQGSQAAVVLIITEQLPLNASSTATSSPPGSTITAIVFETAAGDTIVRLLDDFSGTVRRRGSTPDVLRARLLKQLIRALTALASQQP